MKKPILFSTPMVKSILEGKKTQTRRIMKPQPHEQLLPCGTGKRYWANNPNDLKATYFKSKYEIGDILWVRETWKESFDLKSYIYKADGHTDTAWKWKPSIFMPKAACRIKLEVTNIRVEKLQDISEEDAIAEGISQVDYQPILYNNYLCGKLFTIHLPHDLDIKDTYGFTNPVNSYHSLWDSINEIGSWDKNPWVFVIEFKLLNQ